MIKDIETRGATLVDDDGVLSPVVSLRLVAEDDQRWVFKIDAVTAVDVGAELMEEAWASIHGRRLYRLLMSRFGLEFDEVTRLLEEFPLLEQEAQAEPLKRLAILRVDELPTEGRLAQLRAVGDSVFAWVGDRWEPVPLKSEDDK